MTKRTNKVDVDPVLALGFGALFVVAGAVIYGILNRDDLTGTSSVDTISIHAPGQSESLPLDDEPSEETEPEAVKPTDTRAKVNAVLAAASLDTIEQWSGRPECGPIGGFLGTYSIINSTTFLTPAQAEQLRTYATSAELPIDEFGAVASSPSSSFSVNQANWQISAIYDSEGVVTLRISVSLLEELPDDITASSSFCG